MIKKEEKKVYYTNDVITDVFCDNCGKSLVNKDDFIHRVEISSMFFRENNSSLGDTGLRDFTLDLCEECAKPIEKLIRDIENKDISKNKQNQDITIKDFAKLLNNREYGEEITDEEIKMAKELGFVVVFGASDDLVELRGVIDDEISCYDGGEIHIDKDCEYGIFEECEYGCKYSQLAREKCKVIEVLWCEEENISWTYKTDIPHETFNILEGNEVYCRGIVFDVKNL